MPQSTTMQVKCEKCDNEFAATFYHAEPATDPMSYTRVDPAQCPKCNTPVALLQPEAVPMPEPEPEPPIDESKPKE